LIEAKKALKKYPNNFNIVYVAANVYMIIFSDKKDERAMNKAIGFWRKRCGGNRILCFLKKQN